MNIQSLSYSSFIFFKYGISYAQDFKKNAQTRWIKTSSCAILAIYLTEYKVCISKCNLEIVICTGFYQIICKPRKCRRSCRVCLFSFSRRMAIILLLVTQIKIIVSGAQRNAIRCCEHRIMRYDINFLMGTPYCNIWWI